MARWYKPLLITTKHLTKAQIDNLKNFERECTKKSMALASKTENEEIQYTILRFKFWHRWDESHFPLLEEYIALHRQLESKLAEMKHDTSLHSDKEYRNSVLQIKNSIKLVQEGLGISTELEKIVEQYVDVLFTEQELEDIE